MYLVPFAKLDSDFDFLTLGTILVCTLSTSTNVANWLFATTYFSTGHKFKEIVNLHSSLVRPSVYGSPVS